MKYIKLYEELERFEETWIDDDYDDGNIHPYTIIKDYRLPIYHYITDIIEYEYSDVAYFYDDPVNIDKDLLESIIRFKNIDENDIERLVSGEKVIDNGFNPYTDKYKSYTWEEIYDVLTPEYRKFINNKYGDVLKKYNKKIYEKFLDFEEVWEEDDKSKLKIESYLDYKFVKYPFDIDENAYLVQEYIDYKKSYLYEDRLYIDIKKGFKIVMGNELKQILNNEKSFIYLFPDKSSGQYFKELPYDIQKNYI